MAISATGDPIHFMSDSGYGIQRRRRYFRFDQIQDYSGNGIVRFLCDSTAFLLQVLLRQVVCPAVCPWRWGIVITCWNSSKIISQLVSSLHFADHNIIDLLQGEHSDILAGIGRQWRNDGVAAASRDGGGHW